MNLIDELKNIDDKVKAIELKMENDIHQADILYDKRLQEYINTQNSQHRERLQHLRERSRLEIEREMDGLAEYYELKRLGLEQQRNETKDQQVAKIYQLVIDNPDIIA